MDLGTRQVMNLAIGAWQSEVLYTLVRLDIFTTLAAGPLTADGVAARHGLDPDTTGSLLDAGVALRLLRKQDAQYLTTEMSARLLTADTDDSLVEWVRMMHAWTRGFAQLPEVVRTGKPAGGSDMRATGDPDYLVDQGMGLHRFASRIADDLAACVDGPLVGTLVDVGGGYGAYAMALCRRFPGLRAEVWEMPEVVPQARGVIAEAGLADRVEAVAHDYTTEEYGGGRAAVLMSHVLHQEPRRVAADMLVRARRALAPGGILIVNGSCLRDDRTGPPFATLHNLSATVLWEGGRDFSVSELSELIRAAGFADPRVSELDGGTSTVLTAVAGGDR